MEVVVTTGLLELWTTGAISCAKLQSNHHQETNIQFLYRPDALPVAQPTASKHWREKYHIPWTCLPQTHLGGCLWPLIAPGYLQGGLPCLSSALCGQYPECTRIILGFFMHWNSRKWQNKCIAKHFSADTFCRMIFHSSDNKQLDRGNRSQKRQKWPTRSSICRCWWWPWSCRGATPEHGTTARKNWSAAPSVKLNCPSAEQNWSWPTSRPHCTATEQHSFPAQLLTECHTILNFTVARVSEWVSEWVCRV